MNNEATPEPVKAKVCRRIDAIRLKLKQEREKAINAYYDSNAIRPEQLHFIGLIEAIDLCLGQIQADVRQDFR
jgi:hypothetical protein